MPSKNRLEAFSDGVFAIVITLLVIEITPPDVEHGESLARALWEQWPSYAAYGVSFAVIGVMWLNHHRMFQSVRLVDGPLMLLNLNLLLWTALIPFPTAVVAEYLRDGGEHATTAVAVYGGLLLVTAISFVALYSWITHDARLLHVAPTADELRAAKARFSVGLVSYSIALGLAFVWPPAALLLHAATALYYAFDQASIPAATQQPEPA